MSKKINLGRVTAYADAVAAGYTGTREQFANDLANAANYAAEAGDAAETATEAATTASTAAGTATEKAEEASADAEQAHADAQAILGAKETAVAAAATASSKAGEAANSAQQAAASETAAAGSATTASNAATSATASKNAAATSETNAANSASQAAQTLTNVNQAGATQVAAIQAKGTEVLNSIPADYTKLSNDVDDLKSDLNSKADKITTTYVGENSVTFPAENADPLYNLSISLPLKIAGSGVPSPTNIRKMSSYESDSFSFNNETINVIFNINANVYAGHYDAVNGKLIATMAVVELDNSGWYNTTIGAMSGVRREFPTLKIEANYDNYYCSHLKNEGHLSTGFTDDGIVNLASNYYNVTFVSTSNFTSVDTFIAWLDAQRANNTPVQFAYPLAESVEYNIDPKTIEPLVGDNNVTAIGRNISVATAFPLSELKENVDKISNAIEPYTENYTKQLEPNKKRNICHLGVSKTNNIIIPSQSLADIDRAKRLGFEMIELNVRQTSDGKYICFHGTGGKFGAYFTDVNGNSVADLSPADMTLAEIQSNIRYKTIYDRYKTAPYTLEECLTECLKKGIKPLIEYQSSYTDELSIVDSIMGKNNYGLATYAADRNNIGSNATMYSYLSISDPDDVLAKCETSGGSYVAGINVISDVYANYTEDDWKTLVGKLHAKGYKVSYAYASESLSQLLTRCGFDYNNSSRQVNDFDYGNIVNICDTPTFSGFNTTGTINSGVMILAVNDTVALADNVSSVFLGMCCMNIRFAGTLQIKCGEINTSYTSDGKEIVFISSFCEESAPDMLITANANTVIYSLSFKSSEV